MKCPKCQSMDCGYYYTVLVCNSCWHEWIDPLYKGEFTTSDDTTFTEAIIVSPTGELYKDLKKNVGII